MADEPDDLVLQMLREIRASLDRRFEEPDKRSDGLDGRPEDMAGSLTYSLGFSMQANVRHEDIQCKRDTVEQRATRPEERV